MKWPGSTSDYLAWVTPDMCHDFDVNTSTEKSLTGMTIVDNSTYTQKNISLCC